MRRAGWMIAIVLSPVVAHAITVDECMKSYESAQELRQQHKLIAAREALRVCAQPACPQAARDDCVPWLSSIDSELPTVVFAATCGGKPLSAGQVDGDGQLIDGALDGVAHDADPGMHTFVLRTQNGAAHEQKLAVREGVKNQSIEFAIDPSECLLKVETQPPITEAPHSRLPWVLGVAGAGVVATGFFIGFGLSGVLRRSDMIHGCFPRCDPDEVSSVRTALTIADVSWVIAGVAFVTAAVLYFTDPARHATQHGLFLSPTGVASF